jgi:hypothetical protein
VTARDPKSRLDERVTELLRRMPAAARTQSDWDAQLHRILSRLDAAGRTDSDLLLGPFPEPAPGPAENVERGGGAALPRASRAPRRETAIRKPGFTWLLASVVALAAAALLVIRVRGPQIAVDPGAEPPAARPVHRSAAPAPLAVDRSPEKAEAAEIAAPEPAAPASPSMAGKPPALARATRPAARRPAAATRAPAPVPVEASELEPDPRLKPADGRQPLAERPSAGALTAALDKVLPKARACLTRKLEAVPAEVVFAADGSVLRVNTASKTDPAVASCIQGALGRARVAPFSRPSWSLRYTVRAP